MAQITWEINPNLANKEHGLSNWNAFANTISSVKAHFGYAYGASIMNKVPFYVDNGTENSGYAPIITPVLGKLAVIKLSVREDSRADSIAYQFSHELMHLVYMAHFGLNKPRANDQEESVCSAAALCVIHALYPTLLDAYCQHVQKLTNTAYANGYAIAKKAQFSLKALLPLVQKHSY